MPDETETKKTSWTPLSAAILVGGLSSRMGQDKALTPIDGCGTPMTHAVVERVRAVTSDVFLVGPDCSDYQRFGLPVIPDRFGATGVLGAIATALDHSRNPYCLVVSCDMPLLATPLLRYMAGLPRDYQVLTPVTSGQSRQGSRAIRQTLHAIYARSCLSSIVARLSDGERQIVSFYPDVNIRQIDESVVKWFDPTLATFTSVNTPERLAEVRERLARIGAVRT